MTQWSFGYSSSNTPPAPNKSQVCVDGAYPYTAVSTLWISKITADGIDVHLSLMDIASGDALYVQDRADHAAYATFTATGPAVDHDTYVAVPVAAVGHGTALTNNRAAELIIDSVPAQTSTPPPTAPASVFVSAPWQQPSSVLSMLADGPTVEPLTLDEGKLRAGLDWLAGDPRDDLMIGFIKAARSQVEQDTGLALLTQIRNVTFSADAATALWLPLPGQAWPVQSMTLPDGTFVSGSGFRADGSRRAVQLSAPVGIPGTWQIVSGWPSVDALKAEAPLLVQAVGLLTAHYATFGRDLASEGHIVTAIPMGYDACISPYVQVWIP